MKDFTLTLADLGNTEIGNIETLFAQANGFLGVRASAPILTDELKKKSTPGSFVNGFYEESELVYPENAYGLARKRETMVKLFDLRSMEIESEGVSFNQLVNQEIRLDMEGGILYERYIYSTSVGQQVQIDIESFASHRVRTAYCQKIVIKPLNFSGKLTLKRQPALIAPKAFDGQDTRTREASADLLVKDNQYTTRGSKLSLYARFDHIDETFELMEGQSKTFTQIDQLAQKNEFAENLDYNQLRDEQSRIFKAFWSVSDIEIKMENEDELLQKGIRFNLFHLFNAAGRDGETSIGAKGLTGEGYEGHYFWDTEMYMLPFFIYTQPEIAQSLLEYRLNKLALAKERAEELSFKGALFPWRGISGHETSPYYPAGTAQVHINGDIAYAFQLYDQVTADAAFAERFQTLIYETADFWLSYGFFSKRGFEIHEVTGPDEYTALVNNNFYTNKMAQNNLYFAVALSKRFGKKQQSAQLWQEAADKMYFGYDKERLITQQDDTFLEKQVWNFADTPKENYPLLLHYHPMKIYKHQVLKQADTVLAHMLFEGDKAQTARDFDYYEPLTTHDSSLSRAIYGIVASRLGYQQQAYDFFADSAVMDLSDMQGNAAQGIHAANMGGSWLGIVQGFAHLRIENDEVRTENLLPQQIKQLKFKINFRGKLKEIVIFNH